MQRFLRILGSGALWFVAALLVLIGGGLFARAEYTAAGTPVTITVTGCTAHNTTQIRNHQRYTTTTWDCTGTWEIGDTKVSGRVQNANGNITGQVISGHARGTTAYVHEGAMRTVGIVLGAVGIVGLLVLLVVRIARGPGGTSIIPRSFFQAQQPAAQESASQQ